MLPSILRRLRQISRRIYVRVILLAVLALLALAGASLFGPLIPQGFGDFVGADSVDSILATLASSMLAVTTFSLTIMVTALNNAAGQWTPRSHLILREDQVTQSVLANFLGAFLFSLVGIVMRAAHLFDDRGVVLLFFVTLGIVALIVISLIRWIIHLEGLGSLTHTAATLETQARKAVQREARAPYHGGHALTDPLTQIPKDALPLKAGQAGYLQQVYEDALQTEATEHAFRVFLVVPVGSHVLSGETLAFVAADTGPSDAVLTAATETVLREALPVSPLRSFEQDPLFGVTVLAEVATRALSPGVNDPGTAIDVIHRLERVLATAARGETEITCDRLYSPPIRFERYFDVSFAPISRCAADTVEVHQAIQASLHRLADMCGDRDLAEAARTAASQSLERAEAAIAFGPDLDRLRAMVGAG